MKHASTVSPNNYPLYISCSLVHHWVTLCPHYLSFNHHFPTLLSWTNHPPTVQIMGNLSHVRLFLCYTNQVQIFRLLLMAYFQCSSLMKAVDHPIQQMHFQNYCIWLMSQEIYQRWVLTVFLPVYMFIMMYWLSVFYSGLYSRYYSKSSRPTALSYFNVQFGHL